MKNTMQLRFVSVTRSSMQLHRMFAEVKTKYCRNRRYTPILVTKEGKKHLYLVTVTRNMFYKLLSALRTQESVWVNRINTAIKVRRRARWRLLD